MNSKHIKAPHASYIQQQSNQQFAQSAVAIVVTLFLKEKESSFANFASLFACGAHFDPGRRTSWRRELHLELHQDTVDLPLRSPQFNKEKEESHR